MEPIRAMAARVAARAARSRPTADWPVIGEDDQRGQGLAEYALILALIAIVAIVSLLFLGNSISSLFMAPISVEFAKVLSSLGI